MAQFLKPSNLNNVWASGGDRIYPGDTKYATGWQVEIPPRQYFNEIDYKQDQMLAHLNQHGIPVWDSETEYQADQSYVQGSDGTVYKCLSTNFGYDPISNPAQWEEAFVSINSESGRQEYIGYVAQSTSFAAIANTRYYALTPLTVTLPDSASVASVVTLSKRPNITVTVKVNTGTISTSVGADSTIIFDINDEVNFVFNGSVWEV